MANPRPGVYPRQVDVPGVHSKFLDAHRGVLAELLDLALPPEAISESFAGASRFAARYGFLEKPAVARFRVMDPALRLLPADTPLPDVTLFDDLRDNRLQPQLRLEQERVGFGWLLRALERVA